jgi:hypothetical protein
MPEDLELKLDRYFRELTPWLEEMSDTLRELQQKVGAGEGGSGRDPGRPPPPPNLGEVE